MNPNPDIFRANDIRGIPGIEFDDAFAQKLGGVVASQLAQDNKRLVIGRDERQSSKGLSLEVIAGAVSVGAKVIDIGEVSSPQLYWAVKALGAGAGIMITASHNPQEVNGFKVVAVKQGVSEILGGEALRQLCDVLTPAAQVGGTSELHDIVPEYADAVAKAANASGRPALAIALDGPASVLRVLRRLGPIAPGDGLAAKFDADGDRVMFYLYGRPVTAEQIFILVVEHFGLSPLVFDIRLSRFARERLEHANIPYFLSRVGHYYIPQAMKEHDAAVGGELSGHFYWREFGGLECPELTLLRVLEIGRAPDFERLLASAQPYPRSDEINFPIRDDVQAKKIMSVVEREFAGCRADHTDGLTVDCWHSRGYWFNLRKSNTESLLRLVAEARDQALLAEVLKQLQSLTRQDPS